MSTAPKPGPKPDLHRCENPTCRRLDETVRHDKGLRMWVCSSCWVNTEIPPPKPRRP